MRWLLKKLIVWALGGEPMIRQPQPPYDPAALDKVAAGLKK